MISIRSPFSLALILVSIPLAHCGGSDANSPNPDAGVSGSAGGSGGSGGGSGGDSTRDAGGAGSAAAGAPGRVVPPPGDGAADLVGYWVYTAIMKDGAVVLEREKPLGNGQGLHKFAFAADGRAFYIYNAPTLSDFDHPGTFEVDGDLLTYHEIMKYSCAHPHPKDENSNALNAVSTYSHFRKVDANELWFSVERTTGFNNTPFHKGRPSSAPRADEGTWIVFQRISEQEFYGTYMIRVCQGSPTCVCHDDCKSNDLLREPAPLPACTDTWPYGS